jgi:hypothetical protein
MPGPAPKHPDQRRRRNAPEQWRRLPREGRPGATPPWPLPELPTPAYLEVWAELWRKPQAVVWEEHGAERVVARYVLYLSMTETTAPLRELLIEVRHAEDRLLLTPAALARARMEVAPDEVAEQRAKVAATPDEAALAKRRRLMAVDPVAVARA